MYTHRFAMVGLGALAGSLALVGAASAAEVRIRDAVARVVVVPEARSDIKVEVSGGNRALPVFAITGSPTDVITIDGGLAHRIGSCGGGSGPWTRSNPITPGGDITVRLRGGDRVALKDAPLITIHTPVDVKVSASGAVFGAIGRSSSVTLESAGCGDWTLANTQGQLSVSIAGSGDVHAGSASQAKVEIAGSGDVTVGSVNALQASVAGSGDVTANAVNGSAEAEIAGSGGIHVKGGRVSRLKASIAGSGDIVSDSTVGDLDATIMGSGDVKVAGVSGRLTRQIMGSGELNVAGKSIGRRGSDD